MNTKNYIDIIIVTLFNIFFLTCRRRSDILAGIGFELKKLFNHKGFFSNIKAYAYSTIVSVGPFILCTTMIISIQLILYLMKVSVIERELFLATIVYTFIFSQIITSGFSMVITRFISDKLYSKEFEDILPSFYGITIICLIIGSIPALIFYIKSPLPFTVKFLSYTLYMQLIIMWIQSVYISALKDYIKIVKSFLMGILTTIILTIVFLYFIDLRLIVSLLISMNIGIGIIITTLMLFLQSFFDSSSSKTFLFLRYFDLYPSLFFVNIFYVLGLYIHNFIFWGSSINRIVDETYVYAPIYDVPTFYAYLSTIPAIVIFVVFVETSFYEKYRNYFSEITAGGNYTEINNAKKDMIYVLKTELKNIMELQLFFTIISFVIGNLFLPRIGLSQFSIDIYNILLLGAYLNIIMFVLLLILLYFEHRKGALLTSSVFLLFNILLTYISTNFENTYGLGLFFASLISLLVGLSVLVKYIEKVNYHTFCSQPPFNREKKGLFTKLTNKIYSNIN